MRKRPNDVEKLDQISQSINPDDKGNLTVNKDLGVDGKLKLKSLVSASNPDGDITKALGENSARHGYRITIDDKFNYEIYTTKDYNWTIGVETDISSKLWTDNNYKELRSPGTYPASGVCQFSNGAKALVSMIKINESGYRGINRYSIKDDSFFSGSMPANSYSVVKLF